MRLVSWAAPYVVTLLMGALGAGLLAAWTSWSPRERFRRTAMVGLGVGILVGFLVLADVAGEAIRARRATALHVDLSARQEGAGRAWRQDMTAEPGALIEFQLSLRNAGPGRADGLTAGVNAPPGLEYVCGTLKMRSGAFPAGIALSSPSDDCLGEQLFLGGVDIGNFEPDAVAYFFWQMEPERDLDPGTHVWSVVGVGRAPGKTNEVFNVAIVRSTHG